MSLSVVETVLDETAALAIATEAACGQSGGDLAATIMLRAALALTGVGVCLCDADDRIRYINEAFREALFPGLRCEGEFFTDLIRVAILSEKSMRLDSMPVDAFAVRVREDRRKLKTERAFPLDLKDGRWLYVNDRKLPNGWILAVTMDISSIKREEFRLRAAHSSALRDASTDVLTGIPNRRHGLELAEAAIRAAESNGCPLAVAILDIDHFKRINDTHGHQAGDRVLVAFAALLSRWASPPMVVARLGGEEFLMVRSQSTAAQTKLLLDALARDLKPVALAQGEAEVRYTFSAGVCELKAGKDLDSLLSSADDALYRAKRDGRARVVIGDAVAPLASTTKEPPERRRGTHR